MYSERLFDKGLARASHLGGCRPTGEARAVDPLRDDGCYLAAAQRRGLRITHVTEAHIHADFLGGARQPAMRSGAQLLVSEEGGANWPPRYDHVPLRDGFDAWKRVGNTSIEYARERVVK